MAAWQCINHSGGTLSVSRLRAVRVNTSADRDATALSLLVSHHIGKQRRLSFFATHRHYLSQLSHFRFTFLFFLSGHFKTSLLISSVISLFFPLINTEPGKETELSSFHNQPGSTKISCRRFSTWSL